MCQEEPLSSKNYKVGVEVTKHIFINYCKTKYDNEKKEIKMNRYGFKS